MPRTLPFAAALLLCCAHVDGAGELRFSGDPKLDLEAGQEAQRAGRHLDAVKFFEQVRTKHPFSGQAALADLALADLDFEREKYPEAIEGYRSFLKLRPSHPSADYAQFRIALSHYKDIPSDFVLFPPPTQKDQSAVRAARRSLEDFLRFHPSSSHQPEAQRLLSDVKRRLAEHELYVADFYLHRKRWKAAVGRLDTLLEDYPGVGLDGEALLKLGRAHAALGDKEKAREAWQRLIRDFPDDPLRPEAERLLPTVS